MANANLTNAKRAKNDEFYTQLSDIEKEVQAYLELNPNVFEGKTVLCPCDDPYESNFFKYFALCFNEFKLKKLIATCYIGSPIASTQLTLFDDETEDNKTTRVPHKIEITEVKDYNKDFAVDLRDVEWLLKNKKNVLTRLDGDGDFRSDEVKELRDEADIIVTNPPFSLFREFLVWITEAKKQFLIIGNINAITYKEVFPLIKANEMWLGVTGFNKGMYFKVPDNFVYADSYKFEKEHNGEKVNRVAGCCWFSNIDHGRRHQPLPLMTMAKNLRFSNHKEIRGKSTYDEYVNYNAIDVPFVDAIPSDYEGVMGVPITFLDKYCPEQFEIIGTSDNGVVDDVFKKTQGLSQKFVDDYYKAGGKGSYKEGNPTAGLYIDDVATMAYKRIFIRKIGDTQ
jgi:hypothetical protein